MKTSSGPDSLRNRRQWLSQAGAALLGASLGSGCALRSRPALPARTFLLTAPSASSATRTANPGGTLLVRLLRVAAPYDSRAFVLRRGDSEFATDAYDAFLLSPGPMLTEALTHWMRTLGVFANVSTGGSLLSPTHLLEGEVEELYVDLRDPAHPQAVLTLRLQILSTATGQTMAPRWQTREQRSVPITGQNPDAWVAGWNRALAEILPAVEPSLRQAVAER